MAAAAEQMKIREEGVRMVLRERLGKRRPLAGEYPCHSCDAALPCTMEELLGGSSCPSGVGGLTHRRAASEPGEGGQQLCATTGPCLTAGVASYGHRFGHAIESGRSCGDTSTPRGKVEGPRSTVSSVGLIQGPPQWELVAGPLRYVPGSSDGSLSSSLSREGRKLEAADELHHKVHRLNDCGEGAERGPAGPQLVVRGPLSLTPLVTPRSAEGGVDVKWRKCGISTHVQTSKVSKKTRKVHTESSTKVTAVPRSWGPASYPTRYLQLGPHHERPCSGGNLRAVRETTKRRGRPKELPDKSLTPGKRVSFGRHTRGHQVPLKPLPHLRRLPELLRCCGSWSDSEVIVEKSPPPPCSRARRSASTPRKLVMEEELKLPGRRRVVSGGPQREGLLPPRKPRKGYSAARQRVVNRARERYVLKKKVFKSWVEIKRHMQARRDTQKAVMNIRGKPPVPAIPPPDICHTRTSLLRSSAKLAVPLVTMETTRPGRPSKVSIPSRSPPRPKDDGCAFCMDAQVVSDVRARYAAWVGRVTRPPLRPVGVVEASSSSGGGQHLGEYTVGN